MTRHVWGVGVVVWTCLVAVAVAQEPDLSAMQRRIESLEQEVTDLRSRVAVEQTDWLDQKRAEQVKALVREVLQDADTRASLMDQQMNAGWKNGFFLGSEDGNYLLRIRGLLMVRHTYNHQENPPAASPDENRAGFELARTRFGFFGNVIDPSWQYALWTGHAPNGGVTLLDVTIKKVLENGFSVAAGQFKLPFWREWLISETRLPLVERSLLNTFSGGYVQGVMGAYETDLVHMYLAFTDGLSSANTTFSADDAEYAITGRAEVLTMGQWAQYNEFEGWMGEAPMLVLGAAGHYEQREFGTPADEPEIVRWTTDATLKFDRFSFLGAIVGNHQMETGQVDQWGVLLQAGMFIVKDIEGHIRWEWGESDIAGDEDLSILTVGLDYHLLKHQVRLATDVGYAFNAVSPFWANGNTLGDYRADSPGESGQVVVRTQLQLSF